MQNMTFPNVVVRAAAEDAAFAALRAFALGRRELALPAALRSRSALDIHAEVQRVQDVAESLARRVN